VVVWKRGAVPKTLGKHSSNSLKNWASRHDVEIAVSLGEDILTKTRGAGGDGRCGEPARGSRSPATKRFSKKQCETEAAINLLPDVKWNANQEESLKSISSRGFQQESPKKKHDQGLCKNRSEAEKKEIRDYRVDASQNNSTLLIRNR